MCSHIIGQTAERQTDKLPSTLIAVNANKAPTPNCCAPSATVFQAKTTARLLDIFSVLMYQHIMRVNHKKETAFQCYNFILFYSNFQFFLILLAGRVLGKTIICIFHMLASDVLSCYWSLCLESIFINFLEWHHFE